MDYFTSPLSMLSHHLTCNTFPEAQIPHVSSRQSLVILQLHCLMNLAKIALHGVMLIAIYLGTALLKISIQFAILRNWNLGLQALDCGCRSPSNILKMLCLELSLTWYSLKYTRNNKNCQYQQNEMRFVYEQPYKTYLIYKIA